jgi:hypothetical protein
VEAPPPESPLDPDDSRADDNHRTDRPARRALGRGLGSILSPSPSASADPAEPGGGKDELEALLEKAREEIDRLGNLEQEIAKQINSGESPEEESPTSTNGLLDEICLTGLTDFGHAVEITSRLNGGFTLRSYEDGTLRLAVTPARRLEDRDLFTLSAAASVEQLRQHSQNSFAID